MSEPRENTGEGPLALSSYQKYVVFCAWLGLGFDLMDSMLFNFVSPICIPDLLSLAVGSPEAKAATGFWTGVLTSVMLLGWAIGGIAFGKLSDSIGRSRTVVMTMLIYSLGTGACALAPNVYVLGVFRFIAALGIGGEWAAGAILVAETVPERRRVQMGTLLFTAPPFFVFLAVFANWLFTKRIDAIASNPALSWRLFLGMGAVPAVFALLIRRGLKEPERWQGPGKRAATIRELFSPALRGRTLGGMLITAVALVSFWVVSAFLPLVGSLLAEQVVPRTESLGALKASFITQCMGWFNFGGLLGVLLGAPLATRFGRRPMYFAYFAWSALTIGLVFGLPLDPGTRAVAFGLVGISVYGIFGSFQFYLPELFPTHLRGTGAGFCLNMGRLITVVGPFAVGVVARSGANPIDILRWVAVVPALGVVMLALGAGAETRGEALS